jgi:hypothetical protein
MCNARAITIFPAASIGLGARDQGRMKSLM